MPAFNKYNSFMKFQMNGGGGVADKVVDFDTDTIKVSLHTVSYVPSAATDTVWSELTNEVVGTGYTSGGITLINPTLTESGGVVTFKADNITWAQNAAGFTNARYSVIYKYNADATLATVIGYYDHSVDQSNVVVPFSIIFSSSGVVSWV
jgi:hypothetical protein